MLQAGRGQRQRALSDGTQDAWVPQRVRDLEVGMPLRILVPGPSAGLKSDATLAPAGSFAQCAAVCICMRLLANTPCCRRTGLRFVRCANLKRTKEGQVRASVSDNAHMLLKMSESEAMRKSNSPAVEMAGGDNAYWPYDELIMYLEVTIFSSLHTTALDK